MKKKVILWAAILLALTTMVVILTTVQSTYDDELDTMMDDFLAKVRTDARSTVRLRAQLGLINPANLAEENALVEELENLPAAERAQIVDDTISFLFEKLDGGKIVKSY